MSTPVRIQLRRTKGFNLQEESMKLNGLPAVNCARPSKWGNPWKVGTWSSTFQRNHTPEDAVKRFKDNVEQEAGGHFAWIRRNAPVLLRGKNLACWCSESPCHCDVLLKIANA